MAVDNPENAGSIPGNASTENGDAGTSQASQTVNDQAADTNANAATQEGNAATPGTEPTVDNQTQVVSDAGAPPAPDTPRDQTGKPVSAAPESAPSKGTAAPPLVKGGRVPQTVEEWRMAYEAKDKSYRSSQSEFSKQQARLRQAEERTKSYEGIEPDTIKAFKEQSEQARLKNLPKHDPTHPEHSKFVGLRSTFTRPRQNRLQ